MKDKAKSKAWIVHGVATVRVSTCIEAETEAEALRIADELDASEWDDDAWDPEVSDLEVEEDEDDE